MFPVKINWDTFSKMLVQATAWGFRKLAWEVLCFSRVSMTLSEVQLCEMFGIGPDASNCVHHLCFLCCVSVPLLHKSHRIFGLWHPYPLQNYFGIKDRTQNSPLNPTWIFERWLLSAWSGYMHFSPCALGFLLIFFITLWLSNVKSLLLFRAEPKASVLSPSQL